MTDGDPLVGRVYAGHKLLKKLAEGGMGAVYLAEHETLGRRAAVKVLKIEHCRDENHVTRFIREAQLVNTIGHEGIVDIYDVGRDPEGRAFFVMQLLEGEPLSRRVARGAMPWREVLPIVAGIVRPLAAAHDKGFVHRDLKPDNVWLSYDPYDGHISVKLLDFGIAKLMGIDPAAAQLTQAGAIIGTPHYMAPEQINHQPIDARTDVYALGVMIHEMLRGAPPFAGATLGAILVAHLTEEPPPLAVEGLPPWVAPALARMLSKDPAGRPPTARAALAELEGGATQITRPPPRRWPWLAAGSAIVVAAAAVAIVATRGPRTAPAPQPPPAPAPAPAPTPAPAPPPTPTPAPAVDVEKLRADAQALLRGTLRAVEPATRAQGAGALGEVRDAPSLPPLLDLAARDADLEVRGHAAGAAGAIGLDAAQRQALAALERDAPPPLRVWYAEALARAGDAAARARLAEYAASSELAVAFKAALALADTSPPGDATAIARLKALAAREAELSSVAPYAGAVILSKLGRLRVDAARAQLVVALESEDERARLAAAEGLARLGDDSGKKLLAAVLADEASPNRLVAAAILVALGDDSGYPLLKARLEDADPAVRRLAARVLGQIGERDSLPALAARLSDGDAAVRIAAAAALLGVVGLDPRLLAQASVDWARGALASEDWAVRAGAARLVGDVREREGTLLLAQALADPQPEVRRVAAASAGKLKGDRAARALATAARGERDAQARVELARSLGKLRAAPEARRALTAMAVEPGRAGVLASGALAADGDGAARARVEGALRDKDAALREAAVEAAAGAGWVPQLTDAVADRVFTVRLLAAETLATLKVTPPEVLGVLDEALRRDVGARARAAAALLRAGLTVAGMPSAAELLTAPEVTTRLAALTVVAALPPGEALPLLRRAIVDADPAVRDAAVGALSAFLEADRAGVVALGKLALRDTDPAVRARAAALLAGLLPPLTPPAPADAAALAAALTDLRAARAEVAAHKALVDERAAEIARRTAAPARDDAAVKLVEQLAAQCQAAADAAAAAAAKGSAAADRAELAAGDAPDAAALDEARTLARETALLALDVADAAAAAQRDARAYLASESGDATTAIAAAEAALAAGKLGDARRDLERAAKLLRAAGKDSAALRYPNAELHDRLAARARDPKERRALLEKAKAYYDEAARGSGARAAAARERSAEIVEELKELAP